MKHVILFAVAAALSLTACQKSAEEAEETAQSEGAETTGLKIAYVEMDSLITQYQLYKDYEEELTRKGTNIQSTLAQKQRTHRTASRPSSSSCRSWPTVCRPTSLRSRPA